MEGRGLRARPKATARLIAGLVAIGFVDICRGASPIAPVIDSRMTMAEALGKKHIPDSIRTRLRLVDVRYWSFDGQLHQGQIVCEERIVRDVVELFDRIEKSRFPIRSAIPVARWDGSDSASMANDNSSGFAWRTMWGSGTPSWHGKGLALDLNPRENPAFRRGKASPPGGKLVPGSPGTLSDTCQVVKFLKSRGWKWGAHWRRVQDWQHFEKPLR